MKFFLPGAENLTNESYAHLKESFGKPGFDRRIFKIDFKDEEETGTVQVGEMDIPGLPIAIFERPSEYAVVYVGLDLKKKKPGLAKKPVVLTIPKNEITKVEEFDQNSDSVVSLSEFKERKNKKPKK